MKLIARRYRVCDVERITVREATSDEELAIVSVSPAEGVIRTEAGLKKLKDLDDDALVKLAEELA